MLSIVKLPYSTDWDFVDIVLVQSPCAGKRRVEASLWHRPKHRQRYATLCRADKVSTRVSGASVARAVREHARPVAADAGQNKGGYVSVSPCRD